MTVEKFRLFCRLFCQKYNGVRCNVVFGNHNSDVISVDVSFLTVDMNCSDIYCYSGNNLLFKLSEYDLIVSYQLNKVFKTPEEFLSYFKISFKDIV